MELNSLPVIFDQSKVIHFSRFIGELYELGMLTARILHQVVRKLLDIARSDEESLECLCRF